MLVSFPNPVLAVAPDAVKELQGREALYGLWTLFTKCKGSLQDGHRLENISWRLWYRDLMYAKHTTPFSTAQLGQGHAVCVSDEDEKRGYADGDGDSSSISDRPEGRTKTSSGSDPLPQALSPQSDGGVACLTSCDSPNALLGSHMPAPPLPQPIPTPNGDDHISRSLRSAFPRAASPTPISVGKIIYDMLPSTTTGLASTPSLTSLPISRPAADNLPPPPANHAFASLTFPPNSLSPRSSPVHRMPTQEGQALHRLVDPNIQMTSIIPSPPSAPPSGHPGTMEASSSSSLLAPLPIPSTSLSPPQSALPLLSCLPTPEAEIGELLSGSSIAPNALVMGQDVLLPHIATASMTHDQHHSTLAPSAPFPSPSLSESLSVTHSYPSPSREPSTIDSDPMNVNVGTGPRPLAYSGPPSPSLSDSYAQAHPAEVVSSHPNTSTARNGLAVDRSEPLDKVPSVSSSELSQNGSPFGNVVVQLPPVPEVPELMTGQLDVTAGTGASSSHSTSTSPLVSPSLTSNSNPVAVITPPTTTTTLLSSGQPTLPQPPRLVVVNPTPNPTPHPTPPATPLQGFGLGGGSNNDHLGSLRRSQYLTLPGSSTSASLNPSPSTSTSGSASTSTSTGATSATSLSATLKTATGGSRSGPMPRVYATENGQSRGDDGSIGHDWDTIKKRDGGVGHGHGSAGVNANGGGLSRVSNPHPHLLPQHQHHQRPHQLSQAQILEGWHEGDDDEGSSNGLQRHPSHPQHNANRHSISSTASSHSHVSHTTSSDSSALTSGTNTTSKTFATTGTALTEDDTYSSPGEETGATKSNETTPPAHPRRGSPSKRPLSQPSLPPLMTQQQQQQSQKVTSPISPTTSRKKKRNSAPLGLLDEKSLQQYIPGDQSPLTAPPLMRQSTLPIMPAPGSASSSKSASVLPSTTTTTTQRKRHSFTASSGAGVMMRRASSGRSSSRSERSLSRDPGNSRRKGSSANANVVAAAVNDSVAAAAAARAATTAMMDAAKQDAVKRTLSVAQMMSKAHLGATLERGGVEIGIGVKRGIVVGGARKGKPKVVINLSRAGAAKATRQAAMKRENSVGALETKRRVEDEDDDDDEEDEEDSDDESEEEEEERMRRKSDVISPTTVEDSIRAEVERVKERERIMAEMERVKALEALRQDERRKAVEAEKERLSLLEKQRAEEEEEKRRKEQAKATAGAGPGAGDAEGAGVGKRPVRFNIGSNSDDGSAVGSKSTGSGSDVSGGPSLGLMGRVLQQDQQRQQQPVPPPTLLHATVMKAATDHQPPFALDPQQGPRYSNVPNSSHPQVPLQPHLNHHHTLPPPPLMPLRSDASLQQLPTNPAAHRLATQQPSKSQAPVQHPPPPATAAPSITSPHRRQMSKQQLHQLNMLEQLNTKHHQGHLAQQRSTTTGPVINGPLPPPANLHNATVMATTTTAQLPLHQPHLVGGKAVVPPAAAVHGIVHQRSNSSSGSKDKGKARETHGSSASKTHRAGNSGGVDAETLAKFNKSLAEPLLPQNKRTIVIATSESDFETDSDGDGSWSSEEEENNDGGKTDSQLKEEEDARVLQQQYHEQQHQRHQQALVQQQRLQQQQQEQQRLQQLLQQQRENHPHPAPTRPPGPQRTHSSHYPTTNHNRAKQMRVQQHQQRLAQIHDLEAAAREAQRQRDMFARLPRESFENLAKARTQSVGLLTQLLNPDPEIFPPNHPYRRGFSSAEIRGPRMVALANSGQQQQQQEAPQQPPQNGHSAAPSQPPPLDTTAQQGGGPRPHHRQPPSPLGLTHNVHQPQERDDAPPASTRAPGAPGIIAPTAPAPPISAPAPLAPTAPGPAPAEPPAQTQAQVQALAQPSRPPTAKHQKAPSLRKALSPPVRAPSFTFSKSTAALPVSSQVAVGSVSGISRVAAGGIGAGASAAVQKNHHAAPALLARANPTNGFVSHHHGGGGGGGYRPRGPPPDQVMDDSDSDTENVPAISMSVAQEKLKALAAKRGIRTNQGGSGAQGDAVAQGSGSGARGADASRTGEHENENEVPHWARVDDQARLHQNQQQLRPSNQGSSSSNGNPNQHQGPQGHHAPVAIPLGHPYNLPPAAPPSTPRTTRRRMLSTEMPEDLRLNLLWERRTNRPTVRRTASSGGNRHSALSTLQPLNPVPSMVQLQPKGTASQAPHVTEEQLDPTEKRRRAMERNRSWANDFHYSGW